MTNTISYHRLGYTVGVIIGLSLLLGACDTFDWKRAGESWMESACETYDNVDCADPDKAF